MAKYIDISNWKTQVHVHTGGTRDKFIAISPDDDKKYYFKTSINKGFKNYKYEFWSEVIASELGRSLGFNVLIYDVASFKDKIGCLSKSIIEKNCLLLLKYIRKRNNCIMAMRNILLGTALSHLWIKSWKKPNASCFPVHPRRIFPLTI